MALVPELVAFSEVPIVRLQADMGPASGIITRIPAPQEGPYAGLRPGIRWNRLMALNVGDRLGHHDVTALLGEGGMGQGWQATNTQVARACVHDFSRPLERREPRRVQGGTS